MRSCARKWLSRSVGFRATTKSFSPTVSRIALPGFTHEIADGTGLPGRLETPLAKIEQGVGGSPPSALVIQACKCHIVALTREFALGVHELLGHDEQRDAFDASHQLSV